MLTFIINIKTVLVLLVCGHLFSGILILACTVQHKRDKSIDAFLFSKLFEVIVRVLIGLRCVIPDFLSISVTNTILSIGIPMQTNAFLILREFMKKLRNRYRFFLQQMMKPCIWQRLTAGTTCI